MIIGNMDIDIIQSAYNPLQSMIGSHFLVKGYMALWTDNSEGHISFCPATLLLLNSSVFLSNSQVTERLYLPENKFIYQGTTLFTLYS
jgi:hypothetical protein